MISAEEKQARCLACPHRRNYFCKKHGEEVRRVIQNRATCEGWGNIHQNAARLPAGTLGEKIRLGFVFPHLALGGVTRLIQTMLDAQVDHGLEWAGVAIGGPDVFDVETARRIRRHCPIYCTTDAPAFQGLVEVVPHAAQTVFDRSDVVNLWGYTTGNDEIDAVDWTQKPMLVISHGQCDWTRKNLAVSLSRAGRAIPVAVSEAAARCFQDATQEPHTVIYNGLDFSRCAPGRDRDDVRREWGLKPNQKAIGYIGRLARDKNPLATARAVSALGEDFHAVYVGDGYQAAEITAEVKQICERVTFAPRCDDVGTVLNALDCIITAAPHEGGPLVAAEAWLAGCPVVSTSVGMIPELERDHGPLVWRIPREATPGQLAAAVHQAIEGDARTERARSLAWNQFSPARLVLNYERAIRDALAPDPEPEPTPAPGFFNRLKRWLQCW